MRLQFACHIMQPQIRRAFAGHGHNLHARQAKGPRAKKFPQKPLYTVPRHGIAYFARHSNAHALRLAASFQGIQQEMGAGKFSAVGINGQIFAALAQALLPRKALCSDNQAVGARRLRPFSRRLRIMARPPGVAMRARKPCLRARRILLG